MKLPFSLTTLFLIACLVHPVQAVASDDAATSEHLESESIANPLSPKEMLEKFKLALDLGSFMNGDFYTEENLEKFFGSPYLIKFLNVPEALNVRVFSIDLPAVTQDGEHKPAPDQPHPLITTAKIYLSGAGNNRLTSHSIISTSDQAISADLVQTVFGKPTSITDITPPKKDDDQTDVANEKSLPLGNSSLNYQTESDGIFKTVFFKTGADATVIEIQIYTGRKQ